MRYYDAHNHAHDERFGPDAASFVEAARAAGVVRMVVNGSSAEDWHAVADLARRFPEVVIPSFGVHPWYHAVQPPDWETRLNAWLDEFPTAAVGEIGLDRWKPDLPWEGQMELFIRQLTIAAEKDRPASIHCLHAWGPLLDALARAPRPARGFLVHSFGGSTEVASQLVRLGAYISAPGYFLHPHKAHKLVPFRKIPRERYLIETDAPDQLPPPEFAPYRATAIDGSPLNHPANLPAIYAGLAAAWGEPLEALALQVESNFHALFGPA